MPAGAGRQRCGDDILTERLCLRPLRPADATQLCRLAGDAPLPDAAEAAPCTEARAAAWIARRSRAGTCGLAITHLPFGTLLGVAGWGGSSHIPRLFLWLGPDYRRQGYGREVLDALLHRLETLDATHAEAVCAPDDDAAWHLLERVGFACLGAGADPLGGPDERHFLYDFPPWPDRV